MNIITALYSAYEAAGARFDDSAAVPWRFRCFESVLNHLECVLLHIFFWWSTARLRWMAMVFVTELSWARLARSGRSYYSDSSAAQSIDQSELTPTRINIVYGSGWRERECTGVLFP